MSTVKSTLMRGATLGSAFALALATLMPAVSAYADALNPLTHRSLSLSSSSPGWSYKDGSGNTTYAAPNSGANGQKAGNTFEFTSSTDSSTGTPLKAFTFQYCTSSAGICTSPGNDVGAPGSRVDDASHSDLNVTVSSPSEISGTTFSAIFDTATGSTKVNGSRAADRQGIPAADSSEGNFAVLWKNGATWEQSTGWSMAVANKEVGSATPTGKNNYITIYNTGTGLPVPAAAQIKVVFFATNTNYITNPGAGAFFVKINDYSVNTPTDGGLDASSPALVDGGVTVANVMNQSIQIQTKVLETMQFSVGTVDPNTLTSDGTAGSEYALATGNTTHGICDPITTGLNPLSPTDPVNVLKLGKQDAESSLETDKTYSTHSFWRLSSNSSAGATVYYSGVTLSNTVGDQIKAIGPTATQPHPGSEQFGLALTNGNGSDLNVPANTGYLVDYSQQADNTENAVDNGKTALSPTLTTDVNGNASYHTPQLYPMIPTANYGGGTPSAINGGTPTVTFAFDPDSNTIPVPVATENSKVVDCVTGKMRYIANIAATTPAGIYTTKVNYIAAPQY